MSRTGLWDSHAHLDDEAFNEDREQLIAQLEQDMDGIVNPGCDAASSAVAVELAKKYPFIYAAVGWHPENLKGIPADYLQQLAEWAQHPKVVAIGEIGLDYYWDKDNKEQQKEFFERQLVLAKELKKPVIVHSREAALDTYEVIKASADRDNSGVIHCFSYSKEEAKKYLDMGFYIGIGGVLTFKKAAKIREVAEYVPIDRILLETDCPYLAPEPFRGKRNSSLYIPEVVKKIAEIKQLDYDEVIDITFKNGRRMYGI